MTVARRQSPLDRFMRNARALKKLRRQEVIRMQGPQEGWRRVGAPGQPGFRSGWGSETRGNGDEVLGTAPVRFYKDNDSIVFFDGVLQRMAGAHVRPAFTLPVGYRPSHTVILGEPEDYNHPGLNILQVKANGEIWAIGEIKMEQEYATWREDDGSRVVRTFGPAFNTRNNSDPRRLLIPITGYSFRAAV